MWLPDLLFSLDQLVMKPQAMSLDEELNDAAKQVKVPEKEMTKLLVHRIPFSLPKEELHKIIPGDSTIEMKSNKKAGSGKYSALAIFRNQQQANEAFQDLDGKQEQDSSGRPQKLISYRLSTGETGSLYVCKMACDEQPGQTASKKRSQENKTPAESKKLKLDQTLWRRIRGKALY